MRKRHLDDTEWAQAERIANELHRAGCDHNELRKVLGMTREARNGATMEDVMAVQDLRLKHRRSLARSSSTSGYWETVYQATRPLASMAPERAALVLGWAARILMGMPRTLTTGGRKQWQQNRRR